jgi:hypothetical protein
LTPAPGFHLDGAIVAGPFSGFALPVRSFIALPLIFAIGAATGLGSAYVAVKGDPAFGAVHIGQWVSWPDLGTLAIDPYSLANLARSARLPLASGEGVSFTAHTDDAGRPLDSTCVYRFAGMMPPSRIWTLTVYDGNGQLEPNAIDRNGFTAREIIRGADGSVTVTLAREASPGNWLPLPQTRAFSAVLRLYETSLSPTSGPIGNLALPALTRVSC